MADSSLERRIAGLELVHRVGLALSSERDHNRLIERILVEAKELCRADGGTIYLVSEKHDRLDFAILRNDTMRTALGGTTGRPIDLPGIPLRDAAGQPNHNNIATYAATTRQSVNISDAYATERFDFSGTKAFDAHNRYRSKSFLTIPLLNNQNDVIGVLQLINAREPGSDRVIDFTAEVQDIVEALASQAAVALDNQMLIQAQRALMEAFIQMIAAAIDAKSPYTGGHCERVPILTLMLAEAACSQSQGAFADFRLSQEEWYELKIAAWLHDCGKVTTPVHVMDKATKLETICDRIDVVRARFEVLRRDAVIDHLERGGRRDDAALAARLQALDDDLAFLERANVGGEFLSESDRARIRDIGARRIVVDGEPVDLLSADEVDNLCIARGTLTDAERLVINGHMVQTIRMLEALPFPRDLRRVPEYAGGHHETMDGRGYPKGIFAADMSVPARIMAIADVFEALTAQDRPYKPGKKLSETMQIMGFMKRDNHLDPDLLDLFVTSGVYREYARRYLPPSLIDDVDEAAILAIRPKPFPLPEAAERQARWRQFLPRYQPLVGNVLGDLAKPHPH
jgi:HD-GYP domain-containing protein (c-di-GMP phosphodiesterase class II)